MIYDGKIFKITGASDYEDSSMFNGLIALFSYDNRVDLNYFIKDQHTGPYVRHPYGGIYSFSRDQALCLWAGLKKLKMTTKVCITWVDGKDIFFPGNLGHYKRCWYPTETSVSFLQDLWLKAEILFHAYCTPTAESNQIIAMMMIAGPEYLKLWTSHNAKWEQSIMMYWDSWRNESDFGAHMVSVIKSLIGQGQIIPRKE